MGFDLGNFISGAVQGVQHIHINTNDLATVGNVASSLVGAVDPDAGKGIQSGMQTLQQVAQTANAVGAGVNQASQMVQSVRSSLPPAQVPGFDLAAAIVRGKAAGVIPPPHLPPAAQAAYLATHGMVGGVPAVNAAAMAPIAASPVAAAGAATAVTEIKSGQRKWLRAGVGASLGALTFASGALIAKVAHPVLAMVSVGGAVVGAIVGLLPSPFRPSAPSAHGDAEDAGDKLMSFLRIYGPKNYPVQEVADFQWAAGLPQDGLYTRQVQMALAMTRTGPSTTVPNPVLR